MPAACEAYRGGAHAGTISPDKLSSRERRAWRHESNRPLPRAFGFNQLPALVAATEIHRARPAIEVLAAVLDPRADSSHTAAYVPPAVAAAAPSATA